MILQLVGCRNPRFFEVGVKCVTRKHKIPFLVSMQDVEYVSKFTWSGHPSNGGVYIRTCKRIDEKSKVFFLHNELFNYTPDKVNQYDHINFDTSDNRRSNLEFVTTSRNVTRKWHRQYKDNPRYDPNGELLPKHISYSYAVDKVSRYHVKLVDFSRYFKTLEEAKNMLYSLQFEE